MKNGEKTTTAESCGFSAALKYIDNELSALVGDVLAFNNTIAVGGGATIVLEYLTPTDCIANPQYCNEGLTVSTWTRTNLFLEAGDDPIYLLS